MTPSVQSRSRALSHTLRKILGISLISCCFGQVPGDWLQFRGDRKLTGRSRLAGNIGPPSVSSASGWLPRRESLPTLTYSSAIVNLHTNPFVSNGQTVGNQHADVEFRNIRTSDGYSLPQFGFYFEHNTNSTLASLQFAGAGDPNLRDVPGLT